MGWLLLILLSAFFLGLYAPLMKRALTHEKSTQIIALYPLVGAATIALVGQVDYTVILTPLAGLLLLKAAAVGLTIFMANLALERLPITIYAPLRNMSPIFLLLFSALLLGERVGPVQVAGLLLIVIGAVLLDVDIRQKNQVRRMKRFFKQPAMLLLILASIAISFAPIFDRLILAETDAMTALFWYLTLMAAGFWLIHIAKERRLPFQGVAREDWLLLIAMGAIILASDYLYYKALELPGTILVILIGTRRLSNLVATIIGGTAFHEEHILYKGSMCLVMIAGTVLLVL